MKIKIEAELNFDETIFYNSEEEKNWFYNIILKDELILHSNDIGDTIGKIKITNIKPEKIYPEIIAYETVGIVDMGYSKEK